MRHRHIVAQVIVFLLLCAFRVPAQKGQTASNVRIALDGIYGPLFVTVEGTEKKIAEQAQQAWIIADGSSVVYSSSDGSGGYENEGQGLHIYDVSTGKHKRIMSEYFMVEKVEEVVTSKKKRALLVRMADGGLGASYFAVVDPRRGEVFFRRWARMLERKGDIVVLGFYREDDWEKLDGEPPVKVRPRKVERHNLNTLLLRRVIVNKRDDALLIQP